MGRPYRRALRFRNVWRLFGRLREEKKKEENQERRSDIFWIIASALIYVAEAWYAIDIIRDPANAFNLNVLMGILLGLFGTALIRTWELIGVRNA